MQSKDFVEFPLVLILGQILSLQNEIICQSSHFFLLLMSQGHVTANDLPREPITQPELGDFRLKPSSIQVTKETSLSKFPLSSDRFLENVFSFILPHTYPNTNSTLLLGKLQ